MFKVTIMKQVQKEHSLRHGCLPRLAKGITHLINRTRQAQADIIFNPLHPRQAKCFPLYRHQLSLPHDFQRSKSQQSPVKGPG